VNAAGTQAGGFVKNDRPADKPTRFERTLLASLAIQEGASAVAVARLLGHESAATTLNHYAGLFPTDLEDIASRLNAAARLTIASQRESSDAECQVPVPG
jgi:hypothetical protein